MQHIFDNIKTSEILLNTKKSQLWDGGMTIMKDIENPYHKLARDTGYTSLWQLKENEGSEEE